MIGTKALLTFLGVRAIPPMAGGANTAVHDLANLAQMLSGGHRRVARLSVEAAQAMTDGDAGRRDRAMREQSDVRTAIDDLVRRLD